MSQFNESVKLSQENLDQYFSDAPNLVTITTDLKKITLSYKKQDRDHRKTKSARKTKNIGHRPTEIRGNTGFVTSNENVNHEDWQL